MQLPLWMSIVNCQLSRWQERTSQDHTLTRKHRPSCLKQLHSDIGIYFDRVASLIIMDRSIHIKQNENLRRRSSSPLSSPPSSDDDQAAPVKTTAQQPRQTLNQATPDATVLQTPRSSRTPQQVESNRAIDCVSGQHEPDHTTLWQENPVRYREAPKEPLFPESNICTPPHGTDMATMTMHAASGHTPAAWDERSNMERVGSRTRSQEFASDAMTLPPIRQASWSDIGCRTESLTANRLFQNLICAQSPKRHATGPRALFQP